MRNISGQSNKDHVFFRTYSRVSWKKCAHCLLCGSQVVREKNGEGVSDTA